MSAVGLIIRAQALGLHAHIINLQTNTTKHTPPWWCPTRRFAETTTNQVDLYNNHINPAEDTRCRREVSGGE